MALTHTGTHTRAYAIVVSSIFLLILIYLFNTFAQTCDRSEFYMCIQRVNHIQWQNEMKLKMHFMQKGNLQCLRLSRRTTNTHTRHTHAHTDRDKYKRQLTTFYASSNCKLSWNQNSFYFACKCERVYILCVCLCLYLFICVCVCVTAHIF